MVLVLALAWGSSWGLDPPALAPLVLEGVADEGICFPAPAAERESSAAALYTERE